MSINRWRWDRVMEEIKLEFIQTKTGEETLKINNYLVHSKYNPIREAKQLAEKYYLPHHVHIIFGYGCGYLIEELIKRRAFQEIIIVIDPLFDNNLLEIHRNENNVYYFKSEVIATMELLLNSIAGEARVNFHAICTPNYEKVFPEMYKALLMKVREIQYKNRTNDYTLLRYAKDWQRNFIQNLRNLVSDYNIESLYKKYNCPAVIASGGPSLSKQIALLKEYRDSVVLIAAGSTINTLLANDIEPDYVVTIDGGEPNYNHFKDLHLEKSKIIYSMQNHYKINQSFKNRGYVIGTLGFKKLHLFLQNELNVNLPILEWGGSVAHSAFNVAQYITTGPIALIGQDLAYTNNLTHAESNKNARKIDEDFIKKYEAFQVEGYDGDQVWTNPVFQSMKLDFEAMIMASPPSVTFYNCTEGGVKINGFNQIAFKEFISKYISNETAARDAEEIVDKTYSYDTKQVLDGILENLMNMETIVHEGLELIQKSQSKLQFDAKVLKSLNKIDKKIQKLIDKLPMEPMTSSITIDILQNYLPKENETSVETFERVSAQTKKLYSQLLEAINFTRQCIDDVLVKVEEREELV